MIHLPVPFLVILDREGLESDSPAAHNTFDLLQRKSPVDVGACLNVMNPVLRRCHDGAGTLALRLARSSTKVRDSIAHRVLACSTYLHSFMTTFFAGICFNEHAQINVVPLIDV